MQKKISLKLLPSEAGQEAIIKKYIASAESLPLNKINGFHIIKSSIDARGRQPWISLQVNAFIDEPFTARQKINFTFKDVSHASSKVIIVGAGPAGIFAALRLLEAGIKPIILERGKDVRSRRRDLARLNKEGEVNPESNYCFGEGGAGTYSDGKLYTRSSKRGDINRILQLFVHFGAADNILYEAHPHIGTNKLPGIMTAMRKQLLESGADFHFEKKLTDLIIHKGRLNAVRTADGELIEGDAVILATGHSARDIFQLLYNKDIHIESKPFALGVRVEHPQELIDQLQYHCPSRDPDLPPASYSLVNQVEGKGVFSFCMCPGGIIAPASTSPGELVVNGWSPSKRNNPYANSGIVVTVQQEDAFDWLKKGKNKSTGDQMKDRNDPFLLLDLQRKVEQAAFNAGGGKFVAPAQRMVDFCTNKISASLPGCSYLPGIHSTDLTTVLPSFIYKRLQVAFRDFGKKMKGYYTNEAVLVATESRTSSPIRIPRDEESLEHPQIKGLYPCGEGAGYAGGIVSAAMDGERIAERLVRIFSQ
jgi:uncharacterized FAD-dependent dehydrogenase